MNTPANKFDNYSSGIGEPYIPRTPFFRTEERIAHLLYVAEMWRETPWCPNSDARGKRGGVSCHNLPRSIYIECGALPEQFPVVKGDPNATRHSKQSVMEPFLDARQEFQRLKLANPIGSLLNAGDLVGIRIYQCCDHLGVYLGNGIFVHVLMHKHTDFDLIHVPPWQQRLVSVWRPMELV